MSEDQRARKKSGLVREIEGGVQGESEREREITEASLLSGNCAMACQEGCLMATMQIPIPALMPVISQKTIEEEARTPRIRRRAVFQISFGPVILNGMLPFFLSRHSSESFAEERRRRRRRRLDAMWNTMYFRRR